MNLHVFRKDPNIKPDLPLAQFFRKGMGTEYVAPFLYSVARMARPQKVLEIGLGYTTPWLLSALDDNTDNILIDKNCTPEYFRTPYEPILLCIDNFSISDQKSKKAYQSLKDHRYIRFLDFKFQGKASSIKKEYGMLDFVWFDCGGPTEYEEFCKEYLPICKDYVFFHFTYSNGMENKNSDIITQYLLEAEHKEEFWFRMDIVEPHKHRQGSLTMIRRK